MNRKKQIAKIEKWLDHYEIDGYTIQKDLSVDAEYVWIHDVNLTEIPIQFGVVTHFDCSGNRLTSLKGCPRKGYSLRCYDNLLQTLHGCPLVENLHCQKNPLKSLEGLNIYELKSIDCDAEMKQTEIYKRWIMYRKLSS